MTTIRYRFNGFNIPSWIGSHMLHDDIDTNRAMLIEH